MLGVYDSGVGGLSVLRELLRLLPNEKITYLADTLHIPYGPKPPDEVLAYAIRITEWMLNRGCRAIVVACNTASAAALHPLRAQWPGVPFVGMEPAVKPAAAMSKTGRVAVLATDGTLHGPLYESVVRRFAGTAHVTACPCPGLADCIEEQGPDSPQTHALLRGFIGPLVRDGVDTLVLGCTHYPLARQAIQDIAGPGVMIVDPSPAIAARALHVLDENNLHDPGPGALDVWATGDAQRFAHSMHRLMGGAAEVHKADIF